MAVIRSRCGQKLPGHLHPVLPPILRQMNGNRCFWRASEQYKHIFILETIIKGYLGINLNLAITVILSLGLN